MTQAVFLVHLGATLFMVGVIWFAQLVQYPLFASVPSGEFALYHRRYIGRTALLVAPVMALEGLSALAMLWWLPPWMEQQQVWMGLCLLAVIHGATFGIEIPAQWRLQRTFQVRDHAILLWVNGLRVLGWSARGMLALWPVAQLLPPAAL